MASLKDVHELIHSLNKREKIQFKIFANALGGKAKDRYVFDYEIFINQKQYCKKALTSLLNKNSKRKKLSESNTNLYQCILDSLVSIHKNKIEKVGFLNTFQEVHILFGKGLIEQAKKKYLKLKEKQNTSSGLGVGVEILDFEDSLLLRENHQNYEPRISLLDNQISDTKRVLAICYHKKLKLKLFNLANKIGTPRTQSDLDEYLKLYDADFFEINLDNLPEVSLPYYIVNKAILLSIVEIDDIDKSLQFLKEGLKVVQKRVPFSQNSLPEFHLHRTILNFSEQSSDTNTILEAITTFEKMAPKFISIKRQILSKMALIQAYLYYYKSIKDYSKAYNFYIENKEFIFDTENLKLNPNFYITYFLCSRICFLNKKYNDSLEIINLLLVNKKRIRASLIIHINCLLLLNHFKLNNTLLLPYATRALYRSIIDSKKLYDPERQLMLFLKKTSKVNFDVKKELNQLLIRYTDLYKDSFNASFFGNGDYLIWLEEELKSPSNN